MAHRHRTRHPRAFALALVGVAAMAGPISAQTGPSLRIVSLSNALVGIVDDALTDAYRNPARLTAFGATTVYTGKNVGRSYDVPYPSLRGPRYPVSETIPIENFGSYSSFPSTAVTPIFATLIMTGGETTMSTTVEVDANGSERLDDDTGGGNDARGTIDDFVGLGYASGNENDNYHVTIDVAAGREHGERSSYGSRLLVRLDHESSGDVYEREMVTGSLLDPLETESDYLADSNGRSFEEVEATLSLGWYREEGWLRDVVVGASFDRRTYTSFSYEAAIEDEDYDGNGVNDIGGTPRYDFVKTSFSSDRDYRSVGGQARVNLAMPHGLRGDLYFNHVWGWGDGDATYVFDDGFYRGSSGARRFVDADYGYDGKTREYVVAARVGREAELFDGFRFSSCVAVGYHNQKFEEDADGSGELEIRENTVVEDYSSPFRQAVWAFEDETTVRVPLAFEWDVNTVLVLRSAVEFLVQRNEWETAGQQWADLGDVPPPYFLGVLDHYHYTNYSNTTYLRAGLGLNLKDRFVVDLLNSTSYSGSVDLASFSYLTVLYRF